MGTAAVASDIGSIPASAATEALLRTRLRYIAVGFLMSLVLGLVYAWSIFVIPLQKQFGWNKAETQLTFTLSIATLALGMIVWGRLSDRFGPRKAGIAGAALTTIGFLLASYTDSLGWIYMSYGVLAGLGVGATNICATSTVVRWFPDRKGLALGLLTMGFGLSGFLFGGLLGQFIGTLGWQWAFRVVGVASLAVLVVGSLLLQFPPAGWTGAVPAGSATRAASRPVKDFQWQEMLKTSPWWLWWVWDLVLCVAGLMVMAHIVPLAVSKGLDVKQAAWVMGLFALFNGAGRLLFGWLWDQLGRKRAMVLDGVIMVIGLFGLRFLTQALGFPGLFFSVVCTGLAYGGLPALNSSFVVSSYGPKNAGLHIGLATTPLPVAVFVGPYLGSFVQMAYGYDVAILLGGVVAVVGAIVALFIGDAQEMYPS